MLELKSNFRAFRELEGKANLAVIEGRRKIPLLGDPTAFGYRECLDCHGGDIPKMMEPLTALLVAHGIDLEKLCKAAFELRGHEAIKLTPEGTLVTVTCGPSLHEIMTLVGEQLYTFA